MNRVVSVAATLLLATTVCALGACDRKRQSGLPPADDWGSASAPAAMMPSGTDPAGPLSPHGGFAAGDEPSGGSPDNPHAGMGLNAQGEAVGSGDPHAGMDMNGSGGGDVTQLGLSAPDPNRPIDAHHFVRGVIKLGPKAAGKTTPGGVVFVVVKRADASGAGTGAPLAVDRLTWPATGDLAFELTEANAMVAGTQLDGDVVVSAHYDLDGEARSKQPGDILGEVRVTVPADKVVLPLDNVLP